MATQLTTLYKILDEKRRIVIQREDAETKALQLLCVIEDGEVSFNDEVTISELEAILFTAQSFDVLWYEHIKTKEATK